MPTTVAAIAKTAFDAVAGAITDAVLDGTLNDGSTDYTGRVVLGGENAPAGFPMPISKDKVRPAYLEGYSSVAQPGWTLVADSVTYHVLGVRDIVEAGGFQVANVISQADMLWQSVTFQNPAGGRDSTGGILRSWSAVANGTVTAGLVAMSGAERWASDRVEATSKWRLVCKPVVGVTEASRVVIDSIAYNINFVNDVEQRGVWHVMDLSGGVAT